MTLFAPQARVDFTSEEPFDTIASNEDKFMRPKTNKGARIQENGETAKRGPLRNENEKQQAATASRLLPCFDDEEKMSCAIASKTTRHDLRLEEKKTHPPCVASLSRTEHFRSVCL